MDGVA